MQIISQISIWDLLSRYKEIILANQTAINNFCSMCLFLWFIFWCMWEKRFHKTFGSNNEIIILERAILKNEWKKFTCKNFWKHGTLPALPMEIGQYFNSFMCIHYPSPLKILLQNFIEFLLVWTCAGTQKFCNLILVIIHIISN